MVRRWDGWRIQACRDSSSRQYEMVITLPGLSRLVKLSLEMKPSRVRASTSSSVTRARLRSSMPGSVANSMTHISMAVSSARQRPGAVLHLHHHPRPAVQAGVVRGRDVVDPVGADGVARALLQRVAQGLAEFRRAGL